jgi:hypothetical protein
MDPDIIEEWYHAKTGKESPVSAKGLSPESYLDLVFGHTKLLPELQKYNEVVKFDNKKWLDITSGALRIAGGVVVKFVPWVGWILLGGAELVKLFIK